MALHQCRDLKTGLQLFSISGPSADDSTSLFPHLQVAARNGIDLVSYLKLKDRAKASRILAALNQHTAFKLSFTIAFGLSAFMSF